MSFHTLALCSEMSCRRNSWQLALDGCSGGALASILGARKTWPSQFKRRHSCFCRTPLRNDNWYLKMLPDIYPRLLRPSAPNVYPVRAKLASDVPEPLSPTEERRPQPGYKKALPGLLPDCMPVCHCTPRVLEHRASLRLLSLALDALACAHLAWWTT